jgi:PhoPQ-activated pathogenicity-related protein
MNRLGIIAVIGMVAAAGSIAADERAETALDDYVAAPDATYEWRLHATHSVPGAEVVELRLHSQTWRDVLWRHRLHVIKPDDVDTAAQQGVLVIAGGRWRERYDAAAAEPLPDDAALFVGIARQLGAVVAIIGQVPFQPIFGLREDELIAHTFEQYLATGDPQWPLLLPMVKSAVKAMDATQDFAAEQWGLDLERFTVVGGSKRGWTTWLTGAVDPRAATLVPIVIDVLNFEAHMPHQEAVWGEPSEQIAPYTRRGLDDVLSTDAGRALRRIVDPHSYLGRLEQPKLVVIATNDSYFPLDSLNLYWDDVQAPKRVLYLPNQGHGADDFARLLPALGAVHRHGAEGTPLPELEWEFEVAEGRLRLCVRGDPRPAAVTAWSAQSASTDFRNARFSPREVTPVGDVFVADTAASSGGFTALFAEALFDETGQPFMLSTNVRLADAAGNAPFPATAIQGTAGVCP